MSLCSAGRLNQQASWAFSFMLMFLLVATNKGTKTTHVSVKTNHSEYITGADADILHRRGP